MKLKLSGTFITVPIQKRYEVKFEEMEVGETAWQHITTESYNNLNEAEDRFFAAVIACKNSVASVRITVRDTKINNNEIAHLTYLHC